MDIMFKSVSPLSKLFINVYISTAVSLRDISYLLAVFALKSKVSRIGV